jgi:hypothetical protein
MSRTFRGTSVFDQLRMSSAHVRRHATARYSFAVDGGAISLITPVKNATIPAGAVIVGGVISVPTASGAVTSLGSATVSIGLSAGGAGAAALLAATAKATFANSALLQMIPKSSDSTTQILMSAAGTITCTVAVAALTAGIIDILVEYVIPNEA